MAEKLCELKKKGGGSREPKKTNLWTNSTSASTPAGNISLSQSYQNFDFIEVIYKYPNQSESLTTTKHIYILPDELYNSQEVQNSALVGLVNRTSAQANLGGYLIGINNNWNTIKYVKVSGSINLVQINGITL